jgi:predicted DCC family thiol-disulfide oxidoreductase YuxK
MTSESGCLDPASPGLVIVYDEACPFCSHYVRLLRLRETVGAVQLINARSADLTVTQLWRSGYDLNQGMAVQYGGRVYHGADGVHMLALLSTKSGPFNRINRFIFRSKRLASLLYPLLRFGRTVTLRLLGIRKMSAPAIR